MQRWLMSQRQKEGEVTGDVEVVLFCFEYICSG